MHDLPQALPAPGASSPVTIPGPAGALEAIVALPKAPARGLCVVCHPHPLFGGALSNKVVWTLASCALQAGFAVARFNFRGVGASAGGFDNALGETEDALAVVAWMAARVAGPRILAGFSFGAHVALKAAPRAQAAALVTIAPPFGRYVDAAVPPPHPGCAWLAVHSSDDEVVAYADSHAALMAYAPPPEFIPFDHAGHFFHGRLGDLQSAVLPFLQRVPVAA